MDGDPVLSPKPSEEITFSFVIGGGALALANANPHRAPDTSLGAALPVKPQLETSVYGLGMFSLQLNFNTGRLVGR